MSKLFKRLMNELKALGTEVVFANFEKVIIHTKKHSMGAAEEYLDFILATLQRQEVFRYLQLNTRRVWEQLLWLERENWGGVEYKAPALPPSVAGGGAAVAGIRSEEEGDSEGIEIEADIPQEGAVDADDEGAGDGVRQGREDSGHQYTALQLEKLARDPLAFLNDDFDEEEELEGEAGRVGEGDGVAVGEEAAGEVSPAGSGVYGEWNLVTYLPAAAAEYFHFFVGEFLVRYKRRWDELAQQREDAQRAVDGGGELSQGSTQGMEADEALCDDATLAYRVDDFMRGLVSGKVTKKLLEVVEELLSVYGSGGDAFPRRAGSHLTPKNPALEFSKALMHVLALDTQLEAEIATLRRNLLTKV